MEKIPYELIARYLANECNDDEKQQINEWRRQHPEWMDELLEIWDQTSSKAFAPDVEQALLNVNQRIASTKKKNTQRRFFALISSVAAVAAVVLLVISSLKTPNTNILPGGDANSLLTTLRTNVNEMRQYHLPDGSTVWLNQSSSLRYPQTFEGNKREVYLDGEAFFDIAPNADKPFIIYANNTLTQVVGTSFGIRAVGNEPAVMVTVSTGIVNFSTEGKHGHLQLKKGEQGLCKAKEHELVKNTNPDPNVLAWKTRKLLFDQTSLTDVSKVIANTYQTPIAVDSSIGDLKLTSTFDQLSLDEVLQIIEISLPVRAKTDTNGILLTAK